MSSKNRQGIGEVDNAEQFMKGALLRVREQREIT
jgi:hypothetical protein